MDFGGIIKRSWQITWQFRALWVLGVFAGVSGCTGGGSPGGGGDGGGGMDPGSGTGPGLAELERVLERLQEFLPLIAGLVVLFVFAGIVWMVFAIAARGGLVTGVNAIEQGSPRRLSELWRDGFGRFWTLLGFEILLKLPLALVGIGMMLAILAPIAGALLAGSDPGPAMLAPICGSLACGLPLLLIASVVLGIVYLIGLRYIMLGGQGILDGARNGWRFFRARFKDTLLMWLINAALNIAASLVVMVPLIVLIVAVAIPLGLAAGGELWTLLAALIPVMIIGVVLVSLAYNAIWGTYTSTLWTLFFRDVTGMAALAAVSPPPLPQPVATGYAPAAAPPSGSGYAPAPEAPPIAPWDGGRDG